MGKCEHNRWDEGEPLSNACMQLLARLFDDCSCTSHCRSCSQISAVPAEYDEILASNELVIFHVAKITRR